MSGLNIVKTRFSLLLLEQLQHEQGHLRKKCVLRVCEFGLVLRGGAAPAPPEDRRHPAVIMALRE